MPEPIARIGSMASTPAPTAAGEDQRASLVESTAASPTLARSPALRKLLLYLWEHRDEPLSEYAIAIDVFGKRSDFDSKTDATVRVQISRLRQKLKEHFEKEGASHSLRLTIPQGLHRLEFHAAPLEQSPSSPRIQGLRRHWMPAVLVLALCGFAYFGIESLRLRNQIRSLEASARLPDLWRALLRPDRLTRVVYPVPVFYSWEKLRVRDVTINTHEGWKSSAFLRPLIDLYGEPTVSQSYSVVSDTSAAIILTRFLAGRTTPLEVSPTASLSLDQYGNDNLIFLGIPPTNAELDIFRKRSNFYFQGDTSILGNRNPLPGEPERFANHTDAKNPHRRYHYGIVGALPGSAAGTELVALMGLHTAALATSLTSPVTLEEFESRWRNEGRPRFFEAVVESISEDGQTKSARIAAFRTVSPNH